MAKAGLCIEVTSLSEVPRDWFIHEDVNKKCLCFGFIDDNGVRRDVGSIGRNGKLKRARRLPKGYVETDDKGQIVIAKDGSSG